MIFYQDDKHLFDLALGWARDRIISGPDPRQGARSKAELEAQFGGAITAKGMNSEQAFRIFSDMIIPSVRPFNDPTSLAFVAAAPTQASLAFDAALGVAEIFAGNWDGGSGAIHAENQALDWLAELLGWPAGAGGVFVSGGTLGNLSALHVARQQREKNLGGRPQRWVMLASAEVHSSIAATARVLDVDLLSIDCDDHGAIDADALGRLSVNPEEVFAFVANAGATNSGAVDPFEAIADFCSTHGIWLHVDGAYGGAALASPQQRRKFTGIERADSFIVDPHKWLFAPYDCCALLYRDPSQAVEAHSQRAAYLDTLDQAAWNPSDLAIHLSRRARGLPFWFSLVVYGTDSYAEAIDRVIEKTAELESGIKERPFLQLVMPAQLSVILFRVLNQPTENVVAWSEQNRRSGELLCLPTRWRGEVVLRLCLVHPMTDTRHVLEVIDTLQDFEP